MKPFNFDKEAEPVSKSIQLKPKDKPETKTARLFVFIYPSLNERLRDRAKDDGVSLASLVHSLLDGGLSQ